MQRKNIIIYKGEEYQLLLFEGSAVFNPRSFGISPVWPKSSKFEYFSTCIVEDFNLKVKDFCFTSDGSCPVINGVEAVVSETFNGIASRKYFNINMPLDYTGALVIAKKFLGDYGNEKDFPCYCYQNVIELIFKDGVLVTTIDHRKAMAKIRKNIDKGLRDINIKKDYKCIKKFVKKSLVGEYFQSATKRRIKKIAGKLNLIKNKKKIG